MQISNLLCENVKTRDQDCSISRSQCPTAHEYKYSRLVRMQTSVKEGANVETGTAKCPRRRSWLVRMQTAVKQGANVETGTRKVSATTELVGHSDAGPGAQAARPHTHLCIPCFFPPHADFKLGKISNSFFLQARDSNEMNSTCCICYVNSTCCICGQHSTCYNCALH